MYPSPHTQDDHINCQRKSCSSHSLFGTHLLRGLIKVECRSALDFGKETFIMAGRFSIRCSPRKPLSNS
uniref:Uncharacterized protein n=1 Tax=Knipowitschia caucasica TaxID=637954 RepID=A0AAV2JFT1_KNICA